MIFDFFISSSALPLEPSPPAFTRAMSLRKFVSFATQVSACTRGTRTQRRTSHSAPARLGRLPTICSPAQDRYRRSGVCCYDFLQHFRMYRLGSTRIHVVGNFLWRLTRCAQLCVHALQLAAQAEGLPFDIEAHTSA